jgi:protein tyrosine/serine phosphatase
MARLARYGIGLLFAAFLVAAPWWYHCHREAELKNFRVVTPGVIYRSGQLNPEGLKRVLHEYGIRTVISLREESGSHEDDDAWEAEYCKLQSVRHIRIPAQPWWQKNSPPPAAKAVQKFMRVLHDTERYPRPVLVHCFAGEHRTGAFIALYRIEFEGWSNAAAIEEMRRCGYNNIDEEWDVRTFIQLYDPTRKREQDVVSGER